MQADASARKQIIDASNEWKQGLNYKELAKVEGLWTIACGGAISLAMATR